MHFFHASVKICVCAYNVASQTCNCLIFGELLFPFAKTNSNFKLFCLQLIVFILLKFVILFSFVILFDMKYIPIYSSVNVHFFGKFVYNLFAFFVVFPFQNFSMFICT